MLGLPNPPSPPYPLACLGVYGEPLRFDHLTGKASRPVGEAPTASTSAPTAAPTIVATAESAWPRPSAAFGLDRDAYSRKLERVLDYLRAGDCYQVNLTDAFELTGSGDLLALYLRLRRAQPTSYGAYLDFERVQAASFSPELHFRVKDGIVSTRPMKGTAGRGRTLEEDLERRAALAMDEKNRAENVMIVDLLRNDLGRVCRFGTVEVPRLFEVQPFGKVLQMTSTVRGELNGKPGLTELFGALFPSGSVTGAPKLRAMEIIRELERRPRGIYTGAIGFATPGGDMVFSVAIRTVVAAAGPAVLGAGSGIVIDSVAEEEYRECLLKASFLDESGEPFRLLETMRLEAGVVRWEGQHLDRLESSARYFGFPFDRPHTRSLLAARASELAGGVHRLRLSLRHDGGLELSSRPLEPAAEPLRVGLADERVDSGDPFLFHKTSRRERQDRALARAGELGLTEVLFLNERGELTEGAISNLFVQKGGRLLTPPTGCGLLPGVGRAMVLSRHANAGEAVLYPEDLRAAEAVYLCSSLRGLRKAEFTGES